MDNLVPPAPTAKGKSQQTFYRDSKIPGFGVRITTSGAIAYIVEKRIHGKVKRITLGRHGNLSVEQARSQAMTLLGKVASGIDPIAEKSRSSASGCYG